MKFSKYCGYGQFIRILKNYASCVVKLGIKMRGETIRM